MCVTNDDALPNPPIRDSINVMKLFLLRWNPEISSWKEGDFRKALAESRESPYPMDWSVREWEQIEPYDWAVLCRVGTAADGIVAIGRFDGQVKEADSWRQDGAKCHYAFFWMRLVQEPLQTGAMLAEDLEKALPEINWHGGHSGIVVPPDQAPALAGFIADAIDSGPPLRGSAPFASCPGGPGELARALRLAFCPETFFGQFQRVLPGLAITFHREGDPDGESPDCGDYRIVVSNPRGGEPLRIDLGGETTLFFGGTHLHFFDNDDEWSVLMDYARRIVVGSMRALVVSSAGKWQYSRLDESDIGTEADAFFAIVDDRASKSCGFFLKAFAKHGAILKWTSWNPEGNRVVELSPDWFRTIAKCSGLDAVLASREADGDDGNGRLSSFEFDFNVDRVECRRHGRRWRVERTALLGEEDKPLVIFASGFKSLFDAVIPKCRKTTVRNVLSRLHAFDVEICWEPENGAAFLAKPTAIPKSPRKVKPQSSLGRHAVEVPLDQIGLYGITFNSRHASPRFLSVSLTEEEGKAISPMFGKMNGRFGTLMDHGEDKILPSRFASDALKLAGSFLAPAKTGVLLAAAGKLMPIFEKAAKIRMPILFCVRQDVLGT